MPSVVHDAADGCALYTVTFFYVTAVLGCAVEPSGPRGRRTPPVRKMRQRRDSVKVIAPTPGCHETQPNGATPSPPPPLKNPDTLPPPFLIARSGVTPSSPPDHAPPPLPRGYGGDEGQRGRPSSRPGAPPRHPLAAAAVGSTPPSRRRPPPPPPMRPTRASRATRPPRAPTAPPQCPAAAAAAPSAGGKTRAPRPAVAASTWTTGAGRRGARRRGRGAPQPPPASWSVPPAGPPAPTVATGYESASPTGGWRPTWRVAAASRRHA